MSTTENPVLAGGESGIDRLTGPTGGYLVGFAGTVVVVALLTKRGWTGPRLPRSVATMLIGHTVTVLFGATWLAQQTDWGTAWESGVRPFLIGGVVKSFFAAWTVWLVAKVRSEGDGDRRST